MFTKVPAIRSLVAVLKLHKVGAQAEASILGK